MKFVASPINAYWKLVKAWTGFLLSLHQTLLFLPPHKKVAVWLRETNFPQLKETTVRRLKDLYKANLLQPTPPKKPDTDDSDENDDAKAMSSIVKELPHKKTVRPLLIGNAQVQ